MKTTFKKEDVIKVLRSMLATPKYNDALFRKKNGLTGQWIKKGKEK